MDRITFEGNFCDIAMCRESPCPYNGMCSQRETWERLKKYEDAEQHGRLVVLPCKVGDVVFVVDCEYLDCNSCDMLEHGKDCPYIDKPICPKGTVRRRIFHYSLIPYLGKTVFLTREEAEAALKGGED